ncbi:MFS transporter-like protein [Tricladium varicosporioides]|nr:MFS transporter-like protein [Hymenoscyphus varicosporioides]
MAFGVLEDATNSMPTGTIFLEAVENAPQYVNTAENRIVLNPEPSDSPKDPLNFPRLRKELLFATIVFGACLTSAIGPLLVPGFAIIAVDFHVPLSNVALLSGALIMGLGVSSYVCSCMGSVFGRRPIFLVTTVIIIASCCWSAAAKSYTSILASRVFQGLGMGGFYALAGTDSINDVFFVHQRGTRVGLWNLAVIASVNITPIISGYVIVALGWEWSFWLLAISFGVLLVTVVFLFPETSFDRSQATTTSLSSPSGSTETNLRESTEKKAMDLESTQVTESPQLGSSSTKRPKWQHVLGVQYAAFDNPVRILPALGAPLILLAHPVVIWSCAMWSVVFTWVIIIGTTASQIYAAPPYNLSTTSVGNLVGIAPLIGSIPGTVLAGWTCDLLSKKLAARNKGVYEPEFRLLVLVPFVLSFAIGSFGLGLAIQNGSSVIVCAIFLAILNFAVGIGCTGIVTYQNDVCKHRAGQAFGLTMLIKSSFAFGLSFVMNDYYTSVGPKKFFCTWGGLTIGVTMLTLPLYVYGKRIRSWASRKNIV